MKSLDFNQPEHEAVKYNAWLQKKLGGFAGQPCAKPLP